MAVKIDYQWKSLVPMSWIQYTFTHESIRIHDTVIEIIDIPIYVSYPDKWKIVTQSQLVDIHALIGNVGGYIGLFLGEMLYILILFQSKKQGHI